MVLGGVFVLDLLPGEQHEDGTAGQGEHAHEEAEVVQDDRTGIEGGEGGVVGALGGGVAVDRAGHEPQGEAGHGEDEEGHDAVEVAFGVPGAGQEEETRNEQEEDFR